MGDLQRELQALDLIATQYLAPRSQSGLSNLADTLSRIHKSGHAGQWVIPAGQPLETKVSAGAYQDGGQGAHEVYAQISMIWDVRPVDEFHVEVFDRSSTAVTLVGDDVLGVVHMDLGDPGAPGCYFHAHVRNNGGGGPTEVFPPSLDVPRFPTLVATPASVVEFVLSELFQTDWRRHASAHAQKGLWLGMQRKWWVRHLAWQQELVRGAGFSPWVEIKEARPNLELFC